MEKLEQITKDVCLKKLKVLRNITFTEEEEKCKHCNNYERTCYTPLKENERFGIRRGALAIYNFWYQNISIKSIPTEHD